MTTITDPLGTPSVTYNKSGKNIQNIIANSGTSFGDAVEIPHVSEETIAVIDISGGTGSSTGAAFLSSSFEIGDKVSVSAVGGSFFTLFDSVGGALASQNPTFYMTFVLTVGGWVRVG